MLNRGKYSMPDHDDVPQVVSLDTEEQRLKFFRYRIEQNRYLYDTAVDRNDKPAAFVFWNNIVANVMMYRRLTGKSIREAGLIFGIDMSRPPL